MGISKLLGGFSLLECLFIDRHFLLLNFFLLALATLFVHKLSHLPVSLLFFYHDLIDPRVDDIVFIHKSLSQVIPTDGTLTIKEVDVLLSDDIVLERR